MAGLLFLEFTMMDMKPDAAIEEEGTAAHATWQEIGRIIGGAEGFRKHYFGRQMENSSIGVHVLGKQPSTTRQQAEDVNITPPGAVPSLALC